MRKTVAKGVLTAAMMLSNYEASAQTLNSFALNVTISDYMPNIYVGAGQNNKGYANQFPMLISLLGPATVVWSTNCTNSVSGA